MLSRCACLLVGNGNSIRTWVPGLLTFILIPNEGANLDIATLVSELLNQKTWDLAKLNSLFDELTIKLIQKIPLSVFS